MEDVRNISGNGYEIHYSGGRLADVVIDGSAVECVQVRDYDFATGQFTEEEPTDSEIRYRVAAFIEEAGGVALYADNL